MGNIKNIVKIVFIGIVSILFSILVIYFILNIFSLGMFLTSGLFVSLILIQNGILGFLIFLFSRLIGAFFDHRLEILIVTLMNFLIVNVLDLLTETQIGLEKSGEFVIYRHTVVDSSNFTISSLLVVLLVSILLLLTFYFLEKKYLGIEKS